MNKHEINKRVKALVIDRLCICEEDTTNDADFKKDLGADSLDLVELIMQVETDFSTTIPDKDWEDLDTISKLTNYLHERLAFV